MDPDERYIWATIRPSAVKSVAHMDSYFASIAAQDVGDCQQYFALVQESPRGLPGPLTWIAFLVQPASQVPFLEETYLPIWPCRVGTREPLHPGFDWPFGDCVLYTGDLLEFVPNVVDTGRQPQVLPRPESERFIKLVMVDRRVMKRKSLEGHGTITEEREPTGCSSGCGSVRGDLSVSSTWLPVQPGQIFPPYVKIVAEVSYNMMMDNTGTPKNLEKERKRIMRIIARFYRLSTETTIIWALRIQVGPSRQAKA
ncbi:hypothetical protein B0H11DRAFT_585667 [Mycena galericulata]|nr:hypothetical protein B0H11DRAFT_585667 [Mycena galericulata]